MTPEQRSKFVNMMADLYLEFITRVMNGETGGTFADYVHGYTDRELALRLAPDEPCSSDPYEIDDPKYFIPPHRPAVYRCKAVKPGDKGIVDGCGWQGNEPDVKDGNRHCPNCGSSVLRVVEQ